MGHEIKQIQDGRYTLVYPSGDYRTLRLRTKPARSTGKLSTVLAVKVGNDFQSVAFMNAGISLYFFRTFKAINPPERLARIQKAVQRIAADPEAAGMAYAMKENRCYRCGLALTVPASLHRGLGPDCAKKANGWVKADQIAAYQWRAAVAQLPDAAHTVPDFDTEIEMPAA